MYHCPREHSWIDFCSHNQYCYQSLITYEQMFITKDLVTGSWIISMIQIHSDGFTQHQTVESQFYDSITEALIRFSALCKG